MTFSPSETFRAFRYREFRILWLGAFTSSVGTWMQKVAQSWLVLTLTGSAFWLGLDAFLSDAPFILFSLFGGVLADRVERRRILLVSQLVQMTIAFSLTALVATHSVTVGIILALSFGTGLAQSFGGPAYQALVPTLVERKDVPNAVALNSIQFNLARVVGPVLAGLAFAGLGAAGCFGLNGLSFVAVIFALLALRPRPPVVADGAEPILESLKTGVAEVQGRPPLRGLVGLAFVGSFCSMPLVTFLPVFARDVFHGNAEDLSHLLAAFGVGAVLGAIGMAGVTAQVRRKGLLAAVMLGTFGLLMAAFALSRVKLLSWALLFLAGATLMVVFASFMTLVQTQVHDSLRGRVVSLYSLAFRGAMPLGNLAAGAASKLFPPTTVLVADGLVLVLAAALVLARRSKDGLVSLVDDAGQAG